MPNSTGFAEAFVRAAKKTPAGYFKPLMLTVTAMRNLLKQTWLRL